VDLFRKKFLYDPWDVARLMVPAGLYTVQNNLAYFATSHLDAATYQLLYQLKILTTAVFSVLLLDKALSVRQWASLCVLCLGVGLVQTANAGGTHRTAEESRNSALGLAAVVAACCSSGLAGVYFEKVLKGHKASLWVRNLQLSTFGILLGVLPVLRDLPARGGIRERGFFHGYSAVVWSVVLLQAGGGLLVAMVVKYADNILKGFATSLSIIISCVVSYFLFHFVVTGRFLLGATLVLYAVFVYGSSPAPPQKLSPLQLGSAGKRQLMTSSSSSPSSPPPPRESPPSPPSSLRSPKQGPAKAPLPPPAMSSTPPRPHGTKGASSPAAESGGVEREC